MFPVMPDDELELLREDMDTVEFALDKVLLEGSLHAFVVEMWDVVEPTRKLVDNWHIKVICDELEKVTNGTPGYDRVIINISPGTLKSLIVSVFWPAWMWARSMGRTRVMAASYGAHLSIRDNVRVRSLVESQKYQRLWPIKLVEDQNTKTRFNTDKGGWRIATSVNGPATGEHPHFIIIDDPLTAQQAQSDAERKEANNWFDRTISSRGMTSGVRVVVVMQRLHEEDLTGHLKAKGGVKMIVFPMRYEKCRCPGGDPHAVAADQRCAPHRTDIEWTPDPNDPRTEDGELMCPQILAEDKVAQLERDLGPYGSAGQLQQRPAPEGGGLFKREDFRYCDVVPVLKRSVRGWDTAATKDGGDWTVGVLISEEFEYKTIAEAGKRSRKELVSTGRFYIEDVKREQLGPEGVDALMLATAQADGKGVSIREQREPGASGKTVGEVRRKLLRGYDYDDVPNNQNKVTNAKPLRSQVQGHNVYLKRAPWNETFITELCNFPAGKNDDQVDGASTGFNAVLLEPPPRRQSATW